MRNNIVCC